jgi:aminomethyltransferase
MTQQTPFHDIHKRHNATMVERAGWEVAAHYGDPDVEYQRCREHLGVFDVSWQYRIRVGGKEAGHMLSGLLGDNAAKLLAEHHRYIPTPDEQDKAEDGLVVQRQDKGYVLIGHPRHYRRMLDQLTGQAKSHGGDVEVSDETHKTAMVAMIGPAAWRLLVEKLPFELDQLEPGQLAVRHYLFFRFVISRESRLSQPAATIIMPAKMAGMAWEMLEKYGRAYQATLAGVETLDRLYRDAEIQEN